MNREIKFRIWNGAQMEYNVTVGKFGNFYVNPGDKGDGLDPNDTASLTRFTTKYHENTPVMQYTGLKDRNGKEIYEGDIVSAVNFYNNNKLIGVVEWQDNGYYIQKENSLYVPSLNSRDHQGLVEVIGNIYENQTASTQK